MRRKRSTGYQAAATALIGLWLVLVPGTGRTADPRGGPVAGNQRQRNDWAEGTPGKDNGATRDYYNRAGLLEWRHPMGDWQDAEGVGQGNTAYVTATVTAVHKGKMVEWDATRLVREWIDGKYANQGFFLRTVGGRGTRVFGSREQQDASRRPQLVLTGDMGALTRAPQADTFLDRSTYRCTGHLDSLRISSDPHIALVRFRLPEEATTGKVNKAVLRLYNSGQYGDASLQIGVFRCCQGHDAPAIEPVLGLAAKHPDDRDVGRDPAVFFFANFESEKWADEWSYVAPLKTLQTLDADPAHKFQPLDGKALRVLIPKGETTGLNTLYKFKKHSAAEPEEVFFRYYLRLADDWNQTVQGGKMPGLSGTYGKSGWGGRRSDGTEGWSARGAFSLSIPEDNPLGGLHPIGTYCYHADQAGDYGDIWLWKTGYRGFLEKNRWYCIEQYLRLNTPGEKDGVLRAWVDGRPAFEKTDIRFRRVDRLKIEQVWMNVYHGGTIASPYDQHLFIDNVVIARQYIGPIRRGGQ